MKFNKKRFWDNYKKHFGSIGEKEQGIITSVESLLIGFETYFGWWADVRYIAYALATIKRETANTYAPVREAFWLSETWRKNNLRYYPWYGRGLVQITWEKNYQAMNELLPKHFPEFIEKFEKETGQKFNLLQNKDQAMNPDIAFGILTYGMFRGTFTGKRFSDYINANKTDYVESRRIINGTDKQHTIARYAGKWEKVLRPSVEKETTPENISDVIDDLQKPINIEIEDIEPNPPQLIEDIDSTEAADHSAQSTITHEKEVETADGKKTPEVKKEEPKGEAPSDANFKVEDVKPLVWRWLKRIWGGFGAFNGVQVPAFLTASASNPEYAPYFLSAGGILLTITLLIGLVLSIVLGIILYRNRKELKDYFQHWIDTETDPDKFNYKLEIINK